MDTEKETIEDSEFACEIKMIHKDTVNFVKEKLHGRKTLDALAGFFKLFGDSTRISILQALSESEMCVCDICALLDMKQSAVSHQLKTLKQSRIVKNRREGKMIYYSLDDEHIESVLNIGMQHILEDRSGG